MAATIEAAPEAAQPRERRALFLPGFLQQGDDYLYISSFVDLAVRLSDSLGIYTDVKDMVSDGRYAPIDNNPNEVSYAYSQADYLRDIVEWTYTDHPEADYIPIGFCRGGNLALGLGAFHSADGRIIRASGPIVAIAPSIKLMDELDPWDPARDKGWQNNLERAHSNPYFDNVDEDILWRTFSFPESEVTFHTTYRVREGWLHPFAFLSAPRDMHVTRDFNRGGSGLTDDRYTRDLSYWGRCVKQDVLMIFGEHDGVSPPKNGEALLRILGSTCSEMIVMPNVEHDDFWNSPKVYEKVFDKVVDWLGSRLAAKERP